MQAAPPMKGVGDAHRTGAGSFGNGIVHFELSAHQRLTNDFGQISVKVDTPTQDVSYSMDVTCVNLNAEPPSSGFKQGLIQATVDRVTPVSNFLGISAGDRRLAFIKDGGQPSGTVPVDAYSDCDDVLLPNTCNAFFFFSGVNVEQGNVNIKRP